MNLQQPPEPRNGLPVELVGEQLNEIRVIIPNDDLPLQVAFEVPTVTFWQAIKFSWLNLWNQQSSTGQVVGENHDQEVLPTPLQRWMALNVYPQVTPTRIWWFILGSISFRCALITCSETQCYTTIVGCSSSTVVLVRVIFRWVLEILHTVALAFLLFTGFHNNPSSERWRQYHFLIKSVRDFGVILGACFLILKIIGTSHVPVSSINVPPPSSLRCEAAAHAFPQPSSMAPNHGLILTCVLLTLDALSIINLLRPGHHYYIFEVSITLAMHLTLELLVNGPEDPYHDLGVFSGLFIFIIIIIKNFIWRNVGNGSQTRPS